MSNDLIVDGKLKLRCLCGEEVIGAITFWQHWSKCEAAKKENDLSLNLYNFMNDFEFTGKLLDKGHLGSLKDTVNLTSGAEIIKALQDHIHNLKDNKKTKVNP